MLPLANPAVRYYRWDVLTFMASNDHVFLVVHNSISERPNRKFYVKALNSSKPSSAFRDIAEFIWLEIRRLTMKLDMHLFQLLIKIDEI